jgi:hypothetical protein
MATLFPRLKECLSIISIKFAGDSIYFLSKSDGFTDFLGNKQQDFHFRAFYGHLFRSSLSAECSFSFEPYLKVHDDDGSCIDQRCLADKNVSIAQRVKMFCGCLDDGEKKVVFQAKFDKVNAAAGKEGASCVLKIIEIITVPHDLPRIHIVKGHLPFYFASERPLCFFHVFTFGISGFR